MRATSIGDGLPPIFALDLLGFGHSEKPGISYTQHVWEAQVCDFAIEVMGGRPLVVAGNSIGGGIAAGAAANLRGICRGVVLCNTAGLLVRPEEYEAPAVSWREMTMRRTLPKAFAPVPLFGQRGLDLFGDAVISLIYPQIRDRLASIYDARPENADDALAFAIEQGASSPGSNNVIGSGQKLLPQRPLNEVLNGEQGFGGPVLVLQGLDDRVSGPARAIERADIFEDFRAGVDVRRVEQGGHCVQDEAPEVAAARILEWLPQAVAWKVRQRSLEAVAAE
jgi:pimeloyl-ACP methyl ester carboxylesterase